MALYWPTKPRTSASSAGRTRHRQLVAPILTTLAAFPKVAGWQSRACPSHRTVASRVARRSAGASSNRSALLLRLPKETLGRTRGHRNHQQNGPSIPAGAARQPGQATHAIPEQSFLHLAVRDEAHSSHAPRDHMSKRESIAKVPATLGAKPSKRNWRQPP